MKNILDIERLIKLQKYIKISAVCKDAGLKTSTISTKLSRNVELSVKESNLIIDTLEKAGIQLIDEPQK